MNDLIYIVSFLACCAGAVGLAAVCDRLMPREKGSRIRSNP
jgi:hypothetical protein